MTTTHKIKTWKCSTINCTYHQDFDPNDSVKMAQHFPNVPADKCPACWKSVSHATDSTTRAQINSTMTLQTDTNKQIKVNILSNTEIDNLPAEGLQGKTKAQLKIQTAADRAKYNSAAWKA